MTSEVLLGPRNRIFLEVQADKLQKFNTSGTLCTYTSNPPCFPLQYDFVQKGFFLGANAAVYVLTTKPNLNHPPLLNIIFLTSDVALDIIMPAAGMKELVERLSVMFRQKTTTYEKFSLPLKVALSVIFAYSIGIPTAYVESKGRITPAILDGFSFTNPVMEFVERIEETVQKKTSRRLKDILERKELLIDALENFQLILNQFIGKINIDELNELNSLVLLKKFIVLGQEESKPKETLPSRIITRFGQLAGVALTFFPVVTGYAMTKKALSSIHFLDSIYPFPAIVQAALNACIQLTLVPRGISDFLRYLFRMNSPHSKIAISSKLFPKMTFFTSTLGFLISGFMWSHLLDAGEENEKMLEEVLGSTIYMLTKYINPIMTSMLTVPFMQNLMSEITLVMGRYWGNEEDKKIVLMYFMVETMKSMIDKATSQEVEAFCDLLDRIDEDSSPPSVRQIVSSLGSRSESGRYSDLRSSMNGEDEKSPVDSLGEIVHVEEDSDESRVGRATFLSPDSVHEEKEVQTESQNE